MAPTNFMELSPMWTSGRLLDPKLGDLDSDDSVFSGPSFRDLVFDDLDLEDLGLEDLVFDDPLRCVVDIEEFIL